MPLVETKRHPQLIMRRSPNVTKTNRLTTISPASGHVEPTLISSVYHHPLHMSSVHTLIITTQFTWDCLSLSLCLYCYHSRECGQWISSKEREWSTGNSTTDHGHNRMKGQRVWSWFLKDKIGSFCPSWKTRSLKYNHQFIPCSSVGPHLTELRGEWWPGTEEAFTLDTGGQMEQQTVT